MITQDFARYASFPGFPNLLPVFLSVPGLRFMVMFRACNKFSRHHPIGLLCRLWYKRLQTKYGFQIPFTTRIGPGLFLGHFGNIVINSKASIGSNCNIAQGVTIGQINRGMKKGSPVIGDRVWIGANAVIVGNIKIGNDVLIAPLSFVNFDVPDNCTVIGNPAKVLSDRGSEAYISNIDSINR